LCADDHPSVTIFRDRHNERQTVAKALFFDIDGTLMDTFGKHDATIPQSTVNELHRLQGEGYKIFIASGRPLGFLSEAITGVGFDGYVLFNGGYVEIGGKPVSERRMGFKAACLTAEVLDGLHAQYMIEARDTIYIDRRFERMWSHFSQFAGGDKVKFVQDFDRAKALRECIKLEADFPIQNTGMLAQLWNNLGQLDKIDENGTGNHAEFYSRRISKAVGLQRALDYFGIAREDSYAFGDGFNDLEMVEYAGCGVAMANGVDQLKKVADVIAPPVAEDGMARILRDLFPV